MTPRPYPLLFRPILLEKVWGGRRLERLGKVLPPGALIGESWELADMAATSASGAGGGAQRSIITNGDLAGRTLSEAMEIWGAALLPLPESGSRGVGSRRAATPSESEGARGARPFPLLIKYLDARENLSVQVHPSPAYAAAHPGAYLKTECWYIIDAEPGALIYKGIRPGVTPDQLRRGVESGSIVELLEAVPAVPGDCHNLPSGTVHALGAGVLVAEVQTPSDTTFRLHDWGRVGRELHVAEALACAGCGPAPAAARLADGDARARLTATEFYSIDEVRLGAGEEVAVAPAGGCTVLMVIRGSAVVRAGGLAAECGAGATVLVPAAASAEATARARSGAGMLVVGVGGGLG